MDHEDPDFHVKIGNEKVRFEFKKHHATVKAARKAIEEYICAWEVDASLKGGANCFKLKFDAGQLIAGLIAEKHIEVRKLRVRKAFEQLRKEFSLGVGEAQAIALAQASNARLIVIEDRNGVNACKILKLPFT